jgi:hypothetical protein
MSDLTTRLRDPDEPNALIVRRQAADLIEKLEADRTWLLTEIGRLSLEAAERQLDSVATFPPDQERA